MTEYNLGFIGMGNMGTALYKGFTSSAASKGVTVFTYDKMKPSDVTVGELAERCKYIFLCVKPQQLQEVLEEISPLLNGDKVLVSICAGISAEFVRKYTSETQKVVCVMPNTPMMLNKGASAVSCDEKNALAKNELDFVLSVIGSCSPVVEIVPADKMKDVICVNGSSPAFIYLFAKCFVDYAVGQGIGEESALKLFSQSLIGAADMIMSRLPANEIDGLIAQVSSKGGTTVAGLDALRENGFCEAVKAACEACTKRAYELGKSD